MSIVGVVRGLLWELKERFRRDRVGKEIVASCETCAADTPSTIITVRDGTIVRVQCITCLQVQRYVAPRT